jgi:hypothetical protein
MAWPLLEELGLSLRRFELTLSNTPSVLRSRGTLICYVEMTRRPVMGRMPSSRRFEEQTAIALLD